MTVIKKKAVMPYTVSQMYDLVNDIESYPDFLPWCQTAIVHSRSADEVQATLHLSKGGIKHSFSTVNRLQHNKIIEVRLMKGPFRHLEGFWRFDENPEGGCILNFDLEFVLSNRLLHLTLGGMFEGIANSFLESFCKRADDLYGKKN